MKIIVPSHASLGRTSVRARHEVKKYWPPKGGHSCPHDALH